MAYINVAEWTPDHVAEWLRGLEDSVLPYVNFFLNNDIDGHHLLNLSPDDLNTLHISKIGHQELILEAVDLLRQLHYGLTSETLQFLALKLGCKARSLHSDLKLNGPQDLYENIKQEPVSTDTLSAVSEILVSVKSLISWLDRNPFAFQEQYIEIRKAVLKLSIELASTAQRDQFVEKPHLLIKSSSLSLAELCDRLVQDFNDSLIIQPASLDVTTIKKKPDEELGIHIQSTYSGIHIVGGIKPQSPVTRCAKVEEGDEIVQVNYQTVIGWQLKKLVYAMREHPCEIHLTLKKRPRHTNILGQVIILRPYRIPSKQSAFGKMHKWSEENSPLHIEEVYSESSDIKKSRENKSVCDDDDSAFLPENSVPGPPTHSITERFYTKSFPGGSHAKVQRRATVSGASPTVMKAPVSIEDLVDGVPHVKKKENISRSISHDPSNIKICSGNMKVHSEVCNLKGCDTEERSQKQVDSDVRNEDMQQEQQSNSKCSAASDAVTNKSLTSEHFMQINHIQTSDILTAHEEECVILENKSLEAIKAENLMQARMNCPKIFHGSAENGKQNFGMNPCKKIAIVQSDETNVGAVGSKVEMKSSAPKSGLESYEVVVIGGVPQKKISGMNDGRAHDLLASQQRKKADMSSKLGNRRISCKDLGMGDCQGWLYKQRDKTGFFPSVSQWTKRWIVLKNHQLYCYKDQSDARAECLIILPGSTVSPAIECKTKKFCFKICLQSSAVFYFATETQEDLSKWLNKMGLAAIAYHVTAHTSMNTALRIENDFYSESEDSDDVLRNIMVEKADKQYSLQKSSSSLPYVPDHSDVMLERRKREENFLPIMNRPMRFFERDLALYKTSTPNEPLSSKKMKKRESLQVNHYKTSGQSGTLPVTESIQCFHSPQNGRGELHKECYNRSYSCSESKSVVAEEKQYALREHSCENASITSPCLPNRVDVNQESMNPWSESDDEHGILTASLGRQKPIAKDITPGIVARMAVSYSNLSHPSAILSDSCPRAQAFRNIPSPGYVAKMSGSFDHWARKHSESIKYHQPNNDGNLTCDVSKSSYRNYQRSASETHVGYTHISSLGLTKVIPSSQLATSRNAVSYGEDNNFPKKQLSMLDREYYRLYGRKKVSPVSLKSINRTDSSGNAMKFFPNTNNIQEILNSPSAPQEAFSMENKKNSCSFKPDCCQYISDESKKNVPSKPTQATGYSSPKIEVSPDPFPGSSSSVKTANVMIANTEAAFLHQLQVDYSKGIENIGFYSPDQGYTNDIHTGEEYKNLHKKTYGTAEISNKQIMDQMDNDNELVLPSSSSEPSSFPLKCSTMDHSVMKLGSFKLFGSPKFMKKLNSPKLDKKNIFKTKKLAKETKKAEQKDVISVQNERKLFGSPRLARAIFGSPKFHKKAVVTVSSGVQTDSDPVNMTKEGEIEITPSPPSKKWDTCTGSSSVVEHCVGEVIKSSSNSSLNSNASSSLLSGSTANSHYYVETHIKPQITISLPLVTDKSVEERTCTADMPRTPMKPTMGVSMLGKRRLPSVSGESSISMTSKSSHDDSFCESQNSYSEVKMDIGLNAENDEMVRILDTLRQANLTVDGVDLREKRYRYFIKLDKKRISHLTLELQALHRTLKDKEAELEAIDDLCNQGNVNHEMLTKWIESHPDLFLESTM